MYRWMKWIAPMAAAALLIGLQMTAAVAQDAPTTAPAGKATVNGTVTDSDNNPGADAKVAPSLPKATKSKKAPADAGAADPVAKPAPIAAGATDAEGKVAFPGIADGKYQ